jgi:hypothetical protein
LIEDRPKFMRALFLGLWVYLLIIWVYIVVDSFLFPQYQYMSISIYVPIRQNMLADAAFPLSFVFFVVWAYLRYRANP